MKDNLLPVNAPTFSAGISIDLAGYRDKYLYTVSELKPGSFFEVIATCQINSKGKGNLLI